jgi:hypothetical protein
MNKALAKIAADHARVNEEAQRASEKLIARGTALRFRLAKEELQVSVERGAALLDRELPSWRKKVDAVYLDLEDCERCVLGQIWNPTRADHDSRKMHSYGQGMTYLFSESWDDHDGQSHGFTNRDDYWLDTFEGHETFPFTCEQLKELDVLVNEMWRAHLTPAS